jgi:hypothetical protein
MRKRYSGEKTLASQMLPNVAVMLLRQTFSVLWRRAAACALKLHSRGIRNRWGPGRHLAECACRFRLREPDWQLRAGKRREQFQR